MSPFPSAGACDRNVENGLLCTTIRKMKNICTAEMHGDDVRNQLAVPLAIGVNRNRAENAEEKHPEHDRAVEPAPIRRDLVGERLRGVGVALDVFDRVVVGDKRVHDHARGDRHQGRHQIEGAGSAFDQPETIAAARPQPTPRSRMRRRQNWRAAETNQGKACESFGL